MNSLTCSWYRASHSVLLVGASVGPLDHSAPIFGRIRPFSLNEWFLFRHLIHPTLAATTRIVFCRSWFLLRKVILLMINYIGTNSPLQEAVAVGLEKAPEYKFFEEQTAAYLERRDLFCEILDNVGLPYTKPDGSYFILVNNASIQIPDDFVIPDIVRSRMFGREHTWLKWIRKFRSRADLATGSYHGSLSKPPGLFASLQVTFTLGKLPWCQYSLPVWLTRNDLFVPFHQGTPLHRRTIFTLRVLQGHRYPARCWWTSPRSEALHQEIGFNGKAFRVVNHKYNRICNLVFILEPRI